MYDAIVVGARCSGSATALLLARRGLRVLLVDKGRVATDVISTHFLHPRGNSYLNRMGLQQRLAALTPTWTGGHTRIGDISMGGDVDKRIVADRLARVHGWSDAAEYATDLFAAPRRRVLDKLLSDAAVESGAELRLGFSVEELLTDASGRVIGIRGRGESGSPITERARIVIGADGRHSFVARVVNPLRYHERLRCTYAYYTYFSGVRVDGLVWPNWCGRGRLATVAYESDSGLILVAAMGPREWFHDFRADVPGNFMRTVQFTWPELAERILDGGHREERFLGTADQPAFFHKAHGPGWALVGDAGYQKDQCTAIGMTHALRDSELLSRAVVEGLSGVKPIDDALADYERRRDEDSLAYYEFVCDKAEFSLPTLESLQFLAALRGNHEQMGAFQAVVGDALPVQQFFSPENVARIFREARTDLETPESIRNYQALMKQYAVNPWKDGAAWMKGALA